MTTDHLWQVMVWPLIWPGGENRVCINGLGVNNGDVKITWHLTAMNYKDLTESKTKIAEEASKLDDEGFTTFLLFAVLGDASIIAKKGEEGISLTIGYSKYGLWKGVVDRMGGLGFKERDRKCLKAKIIGIYSSKAIILTRKWLSNPLIKALIEELSQLSDADKLRGGLIELANARVKPLGRSSIEVIDGISMNVHVTKDGYVELKTVRKSHEAAVAVQERLKSTGYDVELSIRGGKFTVYMGMDVIKKYPELAAKVCGVLRRMLNEATSEGNIERAWSIAKAMKNLNCQDPAQGPTGLKPPYPG
ncbi:hypothetical protein [Vulcanisaeta distributa]|uniref:hypothetical protein n=1 Tax=Vulcanisaeta distributa TaxID=164451 RepID=UPI000AC01246|nr:hypothetical protein [Vulcanisaeta distributa]